jgi:cellulose synthase/poly-beta-1,6-N-acetylglucosamine synthase-like glycosyltransferase
MSFVSTMLICLYFGLLAILTVYGIHRTWLLWSLRHPSSSRPDPAPAASFEADPPYVTVQLPVYNERYVVQRLIDAVAALDYPAARLEIQVLDDSTDETSVLIDARVALHSARGINIVHLRRSDRIGFKAGALEAGLASASGELIAVFDADFVPHPDFLLRCTGCFADADVGMVQARWGHLNARYSTLTSAQAALLDGHFLIEHAARHATGRFFNFNGTAGIWRRECIERSGGWQHDTLTEDLDLSYRAQLAGWRFVYLPEVVAPSELPVQMSAFKSQQRRWAKGSIQTALKLLPRLMRSQCSRAIKLEAFFHLTANLSYLWVLLLALLLPVMAVLRATRGTYCLAVIDASLFAMSLLSVTGFYVAAQRDLEPGIPARLKRIPVLMALGTGMAINNGLAVVEALLKMESPFVRTPKHGIERRADRPTGYWNPPGLIPLLELGMGAYLCGGILYALTAGLWLTVPFMAIFMAGFLYVGFGSLLSGCGPVSQPEVGPSEVSSETVVPEAIQS